MEITIGLPRLNTSATDFEANNNHDLIELSDYKYLCLILFSHSKKFSRISICNTQKSSTTQL